MKENKDKLAALEKDVQDAKENKEEAEKKYIHVRRSGKYRIEHAA